MRIPMGATVGHQHYQVCDSDPTEPRPPGSNSRSDLEHLSLSLAPSDVFQLFLGERSGGSSSPEKVSPFTSAV